MQLLPIKLPPGVYKNGTLYSARNRWSVTNKVRWYEGTARPIGGWERATDGSFVAIPPIVSDPATETVRDMLGWTDLTGNPNVLLGSNAAIYYLLGSTSVDVTPAGFVPGPNKPSMTTGYGTGLYGVGTYGTPRVSTGSVYENLIRWDLATWGEDALAAFYPGNTTLYHLPQGGTQFVAVAGAPSGFNDFIVTQQRFVMTVGDPSEYNMVKWCDRENFNDWTPTKTNEAGFQNLHTKKPFTSIGRVLNQALILGLDAYIARHVGPPYVYVFDMVGRDCEAVHPKSVIYTDRFAIWMGHRNFWIYDGTVRILPCDLMDWLVGVINYDQISKMHTIINSEFNEVWWFFETSDSASGEVNAYVSYNYAGNFWMHGYLDRTAGIDTGIFRRPMYIDPDSLLHYHELKGVEVPGAYCETGPLEIGQGNDIAAIRQVIPDTQTFGTVSMTIYGRQMPTAPEYAYGPYAYNNPTPVRAIGRQFRLRFDTVDGSWELGTPRVDVAAGGNR